jgi:hypothetical protein
MGWTRIAFTENTLKMKTLLIVFSTIIASVSFANESRPNAPDFRITDQKMDSSLTENETRLTFHVNQYSANNSRIIYAINAIQDTSIIDNNGNFSIKSDAGSKKLEFLLGLNFHEISTDWIEFKAGQHYFIVLNFRSSIENIMVKKPVIYCYPEEETHIDISLKMTSELTFTYPKYENGWSFIANPNGKITHNNQFYNYLFWESNQDFPMNTIDFSRGEIVESSELLEFLETSLNEFGFNSKEKSDFITYWYPIMKDETNLYIYFMFNEECNIFAELNVQPTPDVIARFYMLWQPVNELKSWKTPENQKIPRFDRTGFTLLEWGGAKLN